MAPTILVEGPYRFFLYSSDGDEPRHVHVERDDKVAKSCWSRFGLNVVAASTGARSRRSSAWWRSI